MEQRVICARCAKIKQACSGGNPCLRCKRLHVSCEPSQAGEAASNIASKPVKITRAHTGCTSCKRRKRKCDEARPKCSDCHRLCLECLYEQPRKQQVPASRDSSNDLSQSLSCSQTLSIDLEPDDIVPDDGTGIESTDFTSNTSWWPFSPSSQRPIYEPMRSTPSPQEPSLSLTSLSAAPMLSADEDKSLLNHYIKVVAVVLSRRDDQQSNPYLSKMLTVAFSNQLVMNALLALSANHWKKLQPSVWKRGVVHQTNTMQALAKLLPNIDSTSTDAALAATLLLAMIELFDGTSSHWKFHLDGVRRLLAAIETQPEWLSRTEYRTFYRQLYHFLDSATTISTCHPPLLESPKDVDAASPSYDVDDESALYGIPRSLFHFVDKLNGLAYQRKFRNDPVFESMFQASATSLEKEIDQWSDEYQRSRSNQTSARDYATTAFEQALQLRLHQVVQGYSLHHEKVKQCVDNILDAVQEIRYGSPLESSLVFPLVMAGSSCDDEHTRRVVQDRFLVMERTLGFRYIYTAHDLVERVWKERDLLQGTDQEVNWAAIRYFHIPGLALV